MPLVYASIISEIQIDPLSMQNHVSKILIPIAPNQLAGGENVRCRVQTASGSSPCPARAGHPAASTKLAFTTRRVGQQPCSRSPSHPVASTKLAFTTSSRTDGARVVVGQPPCACRHFPRSRGASSRSQYRARLHPVCGSAGPPAVATN